METREIFLYITFFIIALSASVSLIIALTYIPLKKLPLVLKPLANVFFQKLYMVIVFSLFTSLVGVSLYVTATYGLLRVSDLREVVRVGIFAAYVVSLFAVTISFKKQTLSPFKIASHGILVSVVLVVATQEETFDFYKYPYILLVLAMCFAIYYGISIFTKKL